MLTFTEIFEIVWCFKFRLFSVTIFVFWIKHSRNSFFDSVYKRIHIPMEIKKFFFWLLVIEPSAPAFDFVPQDNQNPSPYSNVSEYESPQYQQQVNNNRPIQPQQLIVNPKPSQHNYNSINNKHSVNNKIHPNPPVNQPKQYFRNNEKRNN